MHKSKKLLHYHELSRLPIESHLRHARHHHKVPPRRPGLAAFEPKAIWKWISSYAKFVFRPRHRFLSEEHAPGGTSVYQVPDNLKISLAADWATGTDESYQVARQMMHWSDGSAPDLTIHLGDVYYVGSEQEVRENCLGGRGTKLTPEQCVEWPKGKLGSFALSGNHEMYAEGRAYFNVFLPELGMRRPDGTFAGQGASFFCLETSHWRIIGLDTGYNSVRSPFLMFLEDAALPPPLVTWLTKLAASWKEPKGIILLAHHQPFSAFDKGYVKPTEQLAKIFQQRVLFIWGHEHRFAAYRPEEVAGLRFHGRCIGHGGMPVAPVPPKQHQESLLFHDQRLNPHYAKDKLGYNGFVRMTVAGPKVKLEYLSLALRAKGEASAPASEDETPYAEKPELLVQETFAWENGEITVTPPQSQKKLLGFD